MKHLQPIYLFLNERTDNELAATIVFQAEAFFVGIVKRVVDVFAKYVSKCEQYNTDDCSDYCDVIWSTSFNRGKVGSPPTRLVIQPSSSAAGATFDPQTKMIVVHEGQLFDLLEAFEKAATDALSEPSPDKRWMGRDEAAVLMQNIEEYDYNKCISNMSHELVHYYDSLGKSTTGFPNRSALMDYSMTKKSHKELAHLQKMQRGEFKYNIGDYSNSKAYHDYRMGLYASMNHEYNAFFLAYVSDLKRDITKGKVLPATFPEFKDTSINDYSQLRYHRMTPKMQRAVVKRMYDLYTQLTNGTASI